MPELPKPNLRKIKTLVIDDDAAIRAVLQKTLSEWGAEVIEAGSGPRGIAELTRAREAGYRFHLIFLAAARTLMDGFQVAEQLRNQPSEFACTILMVGPEQIAAHLSRACRLGMPWIAKPLTRSAIIGAVSTVLSLQNGEAPPSSESKHKRRFRILLADDNADVGWIIRTQVEGPDYQVDVAQDGSVAADLFRIVDYDLVLMDLQMPNFDGYWATRQIREFERQEHRRHVPIIAVTAFTNEEDPRKSLRAGLNGYLAKPVSKDVLFKVLQKHLGPPQPTSESKPAANVSSRPS
ncbi:MAG TPA: response regulator [Candidatus Binatia bacterium]|nr:response regulator [Candidatus Binatia bacterium]